MSRLQALQCAGQSIWLDFIERKLMASGQLARLIEADGVCGVTSNPAIFQKAIAGGDEYDAAIATLLNGADAEPATLFEALAVEDIRHAADALRPLHERTQGGDGYVSLEVSPHLAADTAGTLAAARHLWQEVARPNLMIKVPATAQGIIALRQLIADGINVNVTLLFARATYRAVAEAYIDGIEQLAAAGGDVSRVASVASFFVSRIDSAVDALLEQKIAATANADERAALAALRGKAAVANAKLAYQDCLEIFEHGERGARWQKLARDHGAKAQRLLWASTGTKNPNYRDVLYVEELIGANTVNTVPPATLDAFRDHGETAPSLTRDLDAARATLAALDRYGISLPAVTDRLLAEGLTLFADADDQLLAAIAVKRQQLLDGRLVTGRFALGALESDVGKTLDCWRGNGSIRRLWARDASLWTGGDEAHWLDWLEEVDKIGADAATLNAFAAELRREGFTTAVLLGMGGSSLGPEVLALVYGRQPDGSDLSGLDLRVLDSVDPAQIAALEATLDFGKTLFIVASKSGSTLEPDIFCRHFHAAAKARLGQKAGEHFVAITDPGSRLRAYATQHGFRRIFDGEPGIGGRYSIYSCFGMLPAALLGLDVARVVAEAALMVNSCRASNLPRQNPGVQLGVMLAVAARAGRDKLTLIASPRLQPFGAWVEQLVAESTGKQGQGIVPVDAEPLGDPAAYGNDRVFVYLRLEGATDAAQDALVQALIAAGHPVATFTLNRVEQLLQEFFRWEIATAVAGAVLGVHPFDQPDVEAAKVQARALLDSYERERRLPPQQPLLQEGDLCFFPAMPSEATNAADLLREFLATLGQGDYFAILAYLPMLAPQQQALQSIRRQVRDARRVATCLGFGPRFLHSTGQLYKGGPDSGVFLVITCDDAKDISVPDSVASFGVVKSAQANGDTAVLMERGRRVLRVHLGTDVAGGLAILSRTIDAALD